MPRHTLIENADGQVLLWERAAFKPGEVSLVDKVRLLNVYGIQYIQKYVRSFDMICDYFEEFATVSPDDDSVFRIAKQMSSTNQDVIGENWVCNEACTSWRKQGEGTG